MSDDTKEAAAKKSELETGVTSTDSEFISMGLAGFEKQSNAMEENEMEARKEWQMVEERELDQGAYRVRYECSEKMDSVSRSTPFELRSLALELWRADPHLEIASFDPLMYPIRGIDSFPVSTDDYQRFFARMSTEKNGQRTHIFGFTIRTMHLLSVLSQRNEKALQGFLSGRKSWLRQHRFSTLLVEPIGWFACKMLGAHVARREYTLSKQVAATANRLNETEEYEGANKITRLPRFEIARRTVYESDGSSENTNALTILCENENSELLKTLMVAADLDVNAFGTFMLLTTRLSNRELQREMYQQHLAFTQDLVAIAIKGLHLDVLEEPILNGPVGAGSTTVRQILLQLERDGGNPIRSIKYTTKSRDEGRFLLVTDRYGAAHTERIVDNELMAIAGRTRSFVDHLHDNEKFADGIRRATRRMTRRELHENGVLARHGSVNGEERSRARQSRRQVVIIDAPWTLDDHPPLSQRKEPAAIPKPRNYAQAVIGQMPQQKPEQQQQQQSAPQQLTTNQGRSSPTNRSMTSDLADDDTAAMIQTLLSTVTEQQAQIQGLIDGNETFKANVHKAVELRMKDQHARNVIVLEEIEKCQKKMALEHQKQLQEKDVHYQNEMLAMMNQFNARHNMRPSNSRTNRNDLVMRPSNLQELLREASMKQQLLGYSWKCAK
jgi:hypothetical protein